MNSDTPAELEQWEPCEPGLLASRWRDSSQNKLLQRPLTVGLLVGALISAVVSGFASQSVQIADRTANPVQVTQQPADLAVLTCDQVAEAFAQRQLGPIDSELRQRVEHHLASCDGCRTALETMQRDGILPADAFLLSRAAQPGWSGLLLADVGP